MGWLQSGGDIVWIKLLYISRSWHFKTAGVKTLIAKNDPTEASIKMKSFLLWIGVFTFLLTTCLAYREVSLISDLNFSPFFISVNVFLVSLYIGARLIWCPTGATREYNFLEHEIACKSNEWLLREYNFLEHEIAVKVMNDCMSEE